MKQTLLMKILSFAFIIFLSSFSWSQLNMDSLSHIDYQLLHAANLNDVWGYVDELGNEYAIVGTSKGTSIVDVTNPLAPQEVFWIGGTESIWRDPSVYGNYAYVTTEAEDGLLIIDLNPLPQSTNLPTSVYTGPLGNPWQSAHTCFLDENGYAYIFGSNRGNGGAIILDVFTNPMNPIEVGAFDNWYVHDGFVRNDTMYLAHISDGFFSIVDCSNKANPVLLATQTTPNNFTHNIWPTNDGNYAFTTDEVSGAYITSYNISDLNNIFEVDRTQNSPGTGVIPHNVHVKNNFLVTSYYSDGVLIHDATYPYNIVKVGQYDTYPTQTPGFDGCWGVYPFLPSGTILAADITDGLFILGANYVQASYLEGSITDFATSSPLENVKVQIVGNDQFDLSKLNGDYATGILNGGSYNVEFTKVGYFPQIHTVFLTNGVVTNFNVQMVAIPPYPLQINVIESGTGAPVADATIILQTALIEHNGTSNALGQENLTLFYQEPYWLTVGKWGHYTNCFEQVIDNGTVTLTVQLTKGYHDEFSFDNGWIVSGTATTGVWERGVPNPTNGGSAPGIDMDYDCSDKAFVTGNDPSLNDDIDDVDGGFTILTSPTMDLTAYNDPHINFSRWFFCMHGNPPDDTLKVIVSNGITSVVIDQTGSNASEFYQWIPKSIRLLDYITPTSSMQVSFRVSDEDGNVNITEAGIDYFHVSNASVLEIAEQSDNIEIFPNPVCNQLQVKGAHEGDNYFLVDINGRILQQGIADENFIIDMSSFMNGTYFIQIGTSNRKVIKI
jgi:choice-of-anchor B domain-containing protein